MYIGRCVNRSKPWPLKADFQSVLRTLESLFTTFVLAHVAHGHFVCACAKGIEFYEFGAICYFERAVRGFLNGRSTLRKRSCRERWENVTKLHTFLSLWIFFVCVGSSDENILMIKVRTERDKGPKKWSLAFDLPKFKMFSGEDKRCRLVSRCWSFIVINHGIVYWRDRQIHDPFWEGNFELELILLQLWSKFSA